MPELFVAEYLKDMFSREGVTGDRIVEFEAPRPLRGGPKVTGFEVLKDHTLVVERWSKILYFRSEENPHLVLASTLGTTGDWFLSQGDQPVEDFQDRLEKDNGTFSRENCRYIFRLASGRHLFYYEYTEFGTLEFMDLPREGSAQGYLFPRPDILDPKFTLDHIIESTQPIYHRIHSQNPFPGMGVCLGSEWLFRAGVNPKDSITDILKKYGREHLLTTLRETVTAGLGVAKQLRDFRQTGDPGSLRGDFLKVYKRENEICVRCERVKIQSVDSLRGSQHCPSCQPQLSS